MPTCPSIRPIRHGVVGILNDAQAALVLSTGRLLRRLEGLDALLIPIDHMADEIARCNQENVPHTGHALSLCYVMFTSGSTGRPKGVMVRHRAVVHSSVGRTISPLMKAGYSCNWPLICFDAATFELWGAALHGARLVVRLMGRPNRGRFCRSWNSIAFARSGLPRGCSIRSSISVPAFSPALLS